MNRTKQKEENGSGNVRKNMYLVGYVPKENTDVVGTYVRVKSSGIGEAISLAVQSVPVGMIVKSIRLIKPEEAADLYGVEEGVIA